MQAGQANSYQLPLEYPALPACLHPMHLLFIVVCILLIIIDTYYSIYVWLHALPWWRKVMRWTIYPALMLSTMSCLLDVAMMEEGNAINYISCFKLSYHVLPSWRCRISCPACMSPPYALIIYCCMYTAYYYRCVLQHIFMAPRPAMMEEGNAINYISSFTPFPCTIWIFPCTNWG